MIYQTGEPQLHWAALPVRAAHRPTPTVRDQAAREPGRAQPANRAADRGQRGPLPLVIARECKSWV